MKKFYRILIGLVFLGPIYAFSQTISVTATITDSDSQTWNNGTWQASLQSPNGIPLYNGNPIAAAQLQLSGVLSGSGVLTGTFQNTSTVFPTGAFYNFTICSNTIAACSNFNTAVTASNLSSALSALITVPRFPASPNAYGYLDAEVVTTPKPGGQYYNVTTPALRIWSGSAWTSAGGAGGATSVSNVDGTLTISPTTGAVIASLNLVNANTWTGAQTYNNINYSGVITATTQGADLFKSSASGVIIHDQFNAVEFCGGGGYASCISKKPWLAVSYGGTGTASFTPGAAGQVGTGATAVCTTSHVCDSVSGDVLLTTGTGAVTTGTILTVTTGITRTNIPNCNVTLSGGVIFYGPISTPSVTAIVVSNEVALTASTAYHVVYNCGGI